MSAGTDGEDGNTSVAGGIVTHSDLAKLSNQAAKVTDSLERFDSHTFLAKHGLVFDSGPTGTNVADLRVLLRG
jgi:hydroxypyruvate reductase